MSGATGRDDDGGETELIEPSPVKSSPVGPGLLEPGLLEPHPIESELLGTLADAIGPVPPAVLAAARRAVEQRFAPGEPTDEPG